MQPTVDPAQCRAAVEAVADWILDDDAPAPARPALAAAVRLTLRTLPQLAPGSSVEVRVPPFAAVQCIEGPRHTRGTPPNVVETDPRTWLRLATGAVSFDDAIAAHIVDASGARAGEIADMLPITPLKIR
ncbi:hypothetical protein GOARA_056_00360 [Gordonia araii NBRC 100433]|uniref:Bacterial SCP orthologue domain-containing protein n=1 Tax=Gordonia araii NBRC 100433 TaxID=1073574 RepID=G7H364_9ACTN|nr:sterol carrier family protein [Gordonia araii]NNG96407.1 hypothetical protein [Gordonia araii NBRC 100433]GAB10289.1 hypothetical protein GOARA_056_00360 [Gordonia araii NBRC 100433]